MDRGLPSATRYLEVFERTAENIKAPPIPDENEVQHKASVQYINYVLDNKIPTHPVPAGTPLTGLFSSAPKHDRGLSI